MFKTVLDAALSCAMSRSDRVLSRSAD